MASTIKVDNVQNTPGTNIVNKCGTTVTVGAASDGIRSAGNNLQASDGGNLISQSGTDITLGASGDTINLASGASQTGFGRTGTVDWITTPKVTGDSPITAVTGKGYFLNTTAGVITINLPAGSAGDIISLMDYAGTWQTNNVTLAPNGSEKIGGLNNSVTLNTEGQSVTVVYVDSTQGWLNTMDSTSNVRGVSYLTATGGNAIVTCGNYKTHVFTGPGTFCVSQVSSTTPENSVTYLVVAGGGGGGVDMYPGIRGAGGGGGGGFRLSNTTCLAKMSPLVAPAGVTVTASPYSITVGAGGAAGVGPSSPGVEASRGGDAIFSSITSTGGGGGGGHSPTTDGPAVQSPGGSGGGNQGAGGTGNTPPVSPAQGTAGGTGGGGPTFAAGGGGGAIAAGANGSGPGGCGGPGGDGSYLDDNAIGPTAPSYGTTGPQPLTRYFSGGGGAAGPGTPSTGGAGGGAVGNAPASNGTVNTGGGGGGFRSTPGAAAGLGGSGIVIIRYKYQ